ncbi:hypothetical protein [Escherichia phage EK010]|uniref:Uncharacterized protein n=2 Tax=Suseptimavirus TaxID=3044836 RepID=A0AAE7XT64_9CAUD|nr:hypothetical protein PQC42_gp022 [Escherichia phage EK010]YP_010673034.1 hypothetical protein PQC43_gp007 [Escherichia phage vB_EcoP-101114UKE3]UEN68508.1 hypothetical protein [Escherichia phage MLP3]USM81256.1 hypothetical protein 101114BS3_129 [Escherichia phage vB_EcoP-101114BS3]UYE89907.1 hypothetical protein [Escherichia phage E20-1]QZI79138.1 hypothetical protein 101114UKE3_007 [Escherichia phage vB_EcoP-101114UKE3]BCG45041.1 hypothetical protein [Escherichia phage EK010]
MFGEKGELTPAQVAEITGRLPGVTEELESKGMEPSTGKFTKGNKFGRPKGSRGKLTQLMLDRVAASHLSPDEVLIQIYEDPNIPPDLRFKAASKVADLVYPKAASVEVKIEEENVINEESLNAQIRDFLTGALKVDVLPPEDSEDAEKEEEADES